MLANELETMMRTAAGWPNEPRAAAFRAILRNVRFLPQTVANIGTVRNVFRSLSLLYR